MAKTSTIAIGSTSSKSKPNKTNSPKNNEIIIESIIETVCVSSISLLALSVDINKIIDIISLLFQELLDCYENNDSPSQDIKNIITKLMKSSNQVYKYTGSTNETIRAACVCLRQEGKSNRLFDIPDIYTLNNNSFYGQEILLSSSASNVILPESYESSESITTKNKNVVTKPTITTTRHKVITNIITAASILSSSNAIKNEEILESITCLLLQSQSKFLISKKEECFNRINKALRKNKENYYEGHVLASVSKVILSCIQSGLPNSNIIELVNALLCKDSKNNKNVIRSCSNLNLLANKKRETDVSTVLSYVSTIDIDDDSSISSNSSSGSDWFSSSCSHSSSSYSTFRDDDDTFITNEESLEKDNTLVLGDNDDDIESQKIKPTDVMVTNDEKAKKQFNDNDDGIQLVSVCDSSFDDITLPNIDEQEDKITLKADYHAEMPKSWKLITYMVNLCIKIDYCCNNPTETKEPQTLERSNVSDDLTSIIRNTSAIKKKSRSTNITSTASINSTESNNNTIKVREYTTKNNKESIETLVNTNKNETILLLKLLPFSSYFGKKDTSNKQKIEEEEIENDSNIEVIIDGINQIFVLATTSDALLISTNNEEKKYFNKFFKSGKKYMSKDGIKSRILKSPSFQSEVSGYSVVSKVKLPSNAIVTNNPRRKVLSNITNARNNKVLRNSKQKMKSEKKIKSIATKLKPKNVTKLVIVESTLGKIDVEVIQGTTNTSGTTNGNTILHPFFPKNSDKNVIVRDESTTKSSAFSLVSL